jgi:hypothetical protein
LADKDEPSNAPASRDALDRRNQRAVLVYTAHDEMDADLVKQFLHGCGIECVVHGRMAPGIYPGGLGDLGKRDVLVLEDDVEDARELLAEWGASAPTAEDPDS